MPYSIEQKVLGLKKEGVRGVAETAITRYIAVDRATEMEYKLNLIQDEQLRGSFDRFRPQPGTKEGTGTIAGIDIQSDNVGEIFHSLLGSDTPAIINDGPGYLHTFKRATGITMPSYTIFVDRGLNKKAYNLGVVKSVAITGAMDGKARMDASVLFKSEAATAATFSPTWADPEPFMFNQTEVKIAGSQSLDVKSWNLTIDNQSVAQRTLNGSQDVKNIITPSKLLVNGAFEVYFESEDERAKFLANAESSLEITLTGSAIETGVYNKLAIKLQKIHYDAFPYGEMDGLLGAAVAFNAYYKTGATPADSLIVELQNTIAAY